MPFDELREIAVARFERAQRRVDFERAREIGVGENQRGIELDFLLIAAALERASPSRMLDHDLAHRARSEREEMRAVAQRLAAAGR